MRSPGRADDDSGVGWERRTCARQGHRRTAGSVLCRSRGASIDCTPGATSSPPAPPTQRTRLIPAFLAAAIMDEVPRTCSSYISGFTVPGVQPGLMTRHHRHRIHHRRRYCADRLDCHLRWPAKSELGQSRCFWPRRHRRAFPQFSESRPKFAATGDRPLATHCALSSS
jgi:hypothetical protein